MVDGGTIHSSYHSTILDPTRTLAVGSAVSVRSLNAASASLCSHLGMYSHTFVIVRYGHSTQYAAMPVIPIERSRQNVRLSAV